MAALVVRIALLDSEKVFWAPVDQNAVPHYLSVIAEPVDLSTIAVQLQTIPAEVSECFVQSQLATMLCNCWRFNGADQFFSPYAKRLWDEIRNIMAVDSRPDAGAIVCSTVFAWEFASRFGHVLVATSPMNLVPPQWLEQMIASRQLPTTTLRSLFLVKATEIEVFGDDTLRAEATDARQWVERKTAVDAKPGCDDPATLAALCELTDAAGDLAGPDLTRSDFGGSNLAFIRQNAHSVQELSLQIDGLVDSAVDNYGPDSDRARRATKLRAMLPAVLRSIDR